jgi:hypothetical protein
MTQHVDSREKGSNKGVVVDEVMFHKRRSSVGDERLQDEWKIPVEQAKDEKPTKDTQPI